MGFSGAIQAADDAPEFDAYSDASQSSERSDENELGKVLQ